jgi:hypothetical protein
MSSYYYRGKAYKKKHPVRQALKKTVQRVIEACKRYPDPTIHLPPQSGEVEAERLMRQYPGPQPADASVNADAKKDGVK